MIRSFKRSTKNQSGKVRDQTNYITRSLKNNKSGNEHVDSPYKTKTKKSDKLSSYRKPYFNIKKKSCAQEHKYLLLSGTKKTEGHNEKQNNTQI